MRALVTGAAGFVGQWTVRAMLARGWHVAGLTNTPLAAGAVLDAGERAAVRWHEGDVRDRATIARLLEAERPDVVVHLAAISFVPAAGADPGATVEVNVAAAARLVGELRLRRRAGTLDPLVLVIGSGEQYGRHEPEAMPLPETAAQRPLSVYAATKAAQEIVALEAARSDGVRVVATRSFNHSGPGQAAHFLLPALVRRALALRASGGRTMPIGNTAPVRDILHVRDVADAYLRLVERGTVGEAYNVASGTGWTVGTLAARVLERVGVRAELVPDPGLVRAVDVPVLVGDSAKLRLATGWTPQLSCDDVIDDLIHAPTH